MFEKDENTSIIKKNNTMLDLLRHEVNTTIGGDRVLKRIEKVILHPEVLRTLSFDQLLQYYDRVMGRQNKAKEFIIDFYRVTSKSQEIQNTLKQYTMIGTDDVIEGEVNQPESEQAIKQALLSKLEILLKEQAEEEEKLKNEG